MNETLGRREAKKQAVRAAVLQAAKQLFAAQGYEATTVRQISEAAGVPERTFYRHFEGKESLIADEAERWMAVAAERIRARPPSESPPAAVRAAFTGLAGEIAADSDTRPIWMFTNHPRPHELLQKSAPRPLLRFEQAITDALLARARDHGAPLDRFSAELTARVSVAILRSAAIHHQEQDGDGAPRGPVPQEAIAEAFERLAGMLAGPTAP